MILLNTTFCIAPCHNELFFDWVRQCYIPAIETKGGSDVKFLRLPTTESDSLTFAVQFCISDHNAAQHWLSNDMSECLAKATALPYGLTPDSLLHFSTIMEIID